jgi:hypothetical protein
MITEKDIKILKRYETRMGKIAHWIVISAAPFFALVGCFNLWLASRIGNIGGYSLGDLFQGFIEGINLNNQYSGLYLKAMERLSTGLFEIGGASVFLIMIYSYNMRRKMDMRILKTLRESGVIKE